MKIQFYPSSVRVKSNFIDTSIVALGSAWPGNPNPFNPETKIKFDLPEDNFFTLKIYNSLDKEILTLVNESRNAGSYDISFDGTNLPSGIYYYKIKAGNFEAVRKMVLLK